MYGTAWRGTFDGMSNEAIRKAIAIAKSHSFEAVAIDGGVSILIPYSNAEGATGAAWHDCYSYREVFATLGY